MKKVNLLSKAEMKKVLGGDAPIGGDGVCFKCCPDGEPESSLCSDPAGPGEIAICAKGKAYITPCP